MIKLGEYVNGNYNVKIYNDGTKIRETINPSDTTFDAIFPENIDLKITNKCDMNCPMCHEKSNNKGLEGDILNIPFIDTLRPFTELAIGGGNVLSHPNLKEFLHILKTKKIIANITVNQIHFEKEEALIKELIDENLIYGLGISLVNPTSDFIKKVKKYPNIVIHLINGIVTKEQLEVLYNNNLKILILGYKNFGKGKEYLIKEESFIEKNKKFLYDNLCEISKNFQTISFDNLALNQLEVKRFLTPKAWKEFYMGDDGSHTMYIDLVEKKYAKNSTSTKRYEIKEDIEKMFNTIKKEV